MENVVLTVHLILALLLIGVVLLQRSEGGGLGMGGGSGVMTGRQAANALTRGTWIIASAFLVTSIALTVIAARNSVGASVVDRISPARDSAPATGLPTLPTYTPPPGVGQPVLPPGAVPAVPAAEAPATPAEPAEAPAPAPAAAAPAPAVPSPAAAPEPAAAESAAPAETTGNVITRTVPITPAPAN